jgi:hypothetical protein
MVEITSNSADGKSEPVSLGSNLSSDELSRRNAEPERIAGFEVYTPGDLKFDSPGGEPRRRGRPKGSRNAARTTTPPPQSNLIENVESLLLSTHFMLSKLLDIDELELDPSEAKRLSDAFKKVAEHYPIGFSPKRLAWMELSIAAGTVYGPRIVTIYKKKPKRPIAVMNQPPASASKAANGSMQSPPVVPEQPKQPPGPRVPSEMWSQDGNEITSDQA